MVIACRGMAKKAAPTKGQKGKGRADGSKKQPKGKPDESVGKELQYILEAFVPKTKEKHGMDEETLRRKAIEAKAYSRKKMLEHREWQRNMNTKIKLRQEALQALPPELMEEASKPDYSLFPLKRMVPTHTVPIPGYEDTLRDADLEEMMSQNSKGAAR